MVNRLITGEIIARCGDTSFLVQTAADKGRVLDLSQKRLFPIMLIDQILVSGYWEDYEPYDGELEELLAQVEVINSFDKPINS